MAENARQYFTGLKKHILPSCRIAKEKAPCRQRAVPSKFTDNDDYLAAAEAAAVDGAGAGAEAVAGAEAGAAAAAGAVAGA